MAQPGRRGAHRWPRPFCHVTLLRDRSQARPGFRAAGSWVNDGVASLPRTRTLGPWLRFSVSQQRGTFRQTSGRQAPQDLLCGTSGLGPGGPHGAEEPAPQCPSCPLPAPTGPSRRPCARQAAEPGLRGGHLAPLLPARPLTGPRQAGASPDVPRAGPSGGPLTREHLNACNVPQALGPELHCGSIQASVSP